MRSSNLWGGITILLIICCCSLSAQANWVTIDFPGAADTRAYDVDGSKVVGSYEDSSGNWHGFLYDGTTWATLDRPWSENTVIHGIDGANLVGYYYNRPATYHAFLYDGTTWTKVDFPGEADEVPHHIDGSNIIGTYVDFLGQPYWYVYRSFLYDGETWTSFKKPGTATRTGTFMYGIDGPHIVGFSGSSGGNANQGFLYDMASETWTTLEFPDAPWTRMHDIDGDNLIGDYKDDILWNEHGLLYDMASETWTALDFPGAESTYAYGIDGDRIVGYYKDTSGDYHGFIYTIPYGGGTGTAEDPYQIWDANHMQAIGADANDWDKCFKLMADIDLGQFDGRDGREEFNMIGAYIGYDDPNNRPFTGVFDGDDHTISNFTCESQDVNCIGIFGHVHDPNALQWVTDPEDPFGRPVLVYDPGIKIKNLHLADPNVESGTGNIVGSLTGFLENAIISSCSVEGGYVSGNECVGGLVGYFVGDIVTCSSATTVRADGASAGGLVGVSMWYNGVGRVIDSCASSRVSGGDFTGGLVGSNNGIIENCHSSGLVLGNSHSGGIAGGNSLIGSVRNSYSTCEISGDDKVGGIVGENSGGRITNCYSKGQVVGDVDVGGLVGINGYSISGGTIENCYSTGEVLGRYDVGGLVGGAGCTVIASFWDVNTSGLDTSAGGEAKTTSEMQQQSTFQDWDFINVWAIGENQTYPYLRTVPAGDINKDRIVNFFDLCIVAEQWMREE
ncbi:MAG: hypothetical protein ISS79_05750 [Phycisphaerae bacterium]|nr:hypothetical protein [Phycisphaerae bacterium]